ncbi:hypothetical protein ADUPG1_008371 [Aduncisulcus paluster]|uniref:Uncharacterized protein n=1 Tax=Aduncisulcus paluster TaxID=2918883 RepID=A0ABQ5KVT7_9EUKA|nr:hypothetical protein ADUPG1_008371 [Aduncisulcus paluster]
MPPKKGKEKGNKKDNGAEESLEEPIPESGEGIFHFPNGRYEGDYMTIGSGDEARKVRHGKGTHYVFAELSTPEAPSKSKKGTDKKKGHDEVPEDQKAEKDPLCIFEGMWAEDIFKEGTIRYQNGSEYHGKLSMEGEYQSGGSYTWASGEKYVGAWEGNVMHGVGMYVDSEGKEWKGIFNHGEGPGLYNEEE